MTQANNSKGKCTACGRKLKMVFQESDRIKYPEHFDNALIMTFSGGYGMFIDVFDNPQPRAIICHDCAHQMCQQLPWLNALLDPDRSHTHAKGEAHGKTR